MRVSFIILILFVCLLQAENNFKNKSFKIRDNLFYYSAIENYDKLPVSQNNPKEGAYGRANNGTFWGFNNRTNKIIHDVQQDKIYAISQNLNNEHKGELALHIQDSLNQKIILFTPQAEEKGMQNASLAKCENYLFIAFSNLNKDNHLKPYLIIYNLLDGSKTDPFEIKGLSQNLGDDDQRASWPNIAIIKDPESGVFKMVSSWYSVSENYKIARSYLISGSSNNPMDPSLWQFSDYLEIKMDNTVTDFPRKQVEPLKVKFGAEGKALAMTVISDKNYTNPNAPAAESSNNYKTLGYVFSLDYGDNWVLREGDKYFSQSLNSENCSPFYGLSKTIVDTVSGSEESFINQKTSAYWNSDFIFDSDNKVRCFLYLYSLNDQNETYYYFDNGTAGAGYCLLTGELTANGLNWEESKFISVDSRIMSPLLNLKKKWQQYTNGIVLSMGKFFSEQESKGFYLSHVDRALNSSVSVNTHGGFANYYGDVYLTTSLDGNIWQQNCLGENVFPDYNSETDPYLPCSPQITKEPNINPGCWQVAPRAILNDPDSTRFQFKIYGTYQMFDANNSADGDFVLGFEQDLYFLEIAMATLGIAEDQEVNTAKDFSLLSNYPNPFNPSTKINYRLKKAGLVKIRIMDIRGRMLKEYNQGLRKKGLHQINFDASKYASGTYIYNLLLNDEIIESKKMMFLK